MTGSNEGINCPCNPQQFDACDWDTNQIIECTYDENKQRNIQNSEKVAYVGTT